MGMVCDKKNKAKDCNISRQPHYKDAVASCGNTTTSLASGSGITSPIAIATLQADSSCVKCPVTILTYSGILTGTAAETITISLRKSQYNNCNCCCNCGMMPTTTTIRQFTITTVANQTLPFTFQFCDAPGQNCGCCDSDCATYTITAVSSAASSAITVTGLSFTALTVENGCCGCSCGCNCGC